MNTIHELTPVTLRRDFDRFFDGFFGSGEQIAATPVDVAEDDAGFHVTVDVPGLALEDLEVTTFEKKLTIRGERKLPRPEGQRVHVQERSAGKFERTVLLPVGVELDKIDARLERGVLHVTLPKSAVAQPKKIAVRG